MRANEITQGVKFKQHEKWSGTFTYVAMGRPQKAVRNQICLKVCILDATEHKERIGTETMIFFSKYNGRFKKINVVK